MRATDWGAATSLLPVHCKRTAVDSADLSPGAVRRSRPHIVEQQRSVQGMQCGGGSGSGGAKPRAHPCRTAGRRA